MLTHPQSQPADVKQEVESLLVVTLTVAGSCTAAAPGRTSPSPPASAAASAPPRTPSDDPAGCSRPDRCCSCSTGNKMAARLAASQSGTSPSVAGVNQMITKIKQQGANI